jgi:tRNA (guanine-N(7)-)-methyltransferase subunit TRM82
MEFHREGKLFASAGDDKLVKIWNADSWHCTKTIRSEKRVRAVSFSLDGQFLIFADKFGVVWVTTTVNADNLNCKTDKADPLLAHCCSIITGLCVLGCNFSSASVLGTSVFTGMPFTGMASSSL